MKSGREELPRVRVSITLPKNLVEWIDTKVDERIYHNRSHAIEVFITATKERDFSSNTSTRAQ